MWRPRRDSNARARFRRAALYPLSYGGMDLFYSPTLLHGANWGFSRGGFFAHEPTPESFPQVTRLGARVVRAHGPVPAQVAEYLTPVFVVAHSRAHPEAPTVRELERDRRAARPRRRLWVTSCHQTTSRTSIRFARRCFVAETTSTHLLSQSFRLDSISMTLEHAFAIFNRTNRGRIMQARHTGECRNLCIGACGIIPIVQP